MILKFANGRVDAEDGIGCNLVLEDDLRIIEIVACGDQLIACRIPNAVAPLQ